MEEAFTALLLADPGVSGLVGSRVHWQLLPASVKGRPYIALQRIASPEDYTLDGRSDLQVEWQVQIDVWAESYGSAAEVERAVRALLAGYAGDVGGIRFHGIFVGQGLDKPVSAQAADHLFGRMVDVNVSWSAL